MNTIGRLLTLTTFGESHGPAIGGVLDGMPSGIAIDLELVERQMSRRRPGQSTVTSARQEPDRVEFLSGIFQGRTTGAPVAFIIRNTDARSQDYEPMKDIYRPSHADYTWEQRYGVRDWRGGGRSSARATAPVCVAGALAMTALEQVMPHLTIEAFISQIGTLSRDSKDEIQFNAEMESLLEKLKKENDSTGGIITCVVNGVPAGTGNPVFDKLQASLAAAMMGINAAKGFEYGDGFKAASQLGSQHNDAFVMQDGKVTTATNHSGGIQGGISNGQPIIFRVAFKPTPTIGIRQKTVTADGKETVLEAKGRHDPCVVLRALPIVESLTALVILDQWLCGARQV